MPAKSAASRNPINAESPAAVEPASRSNARAPLKLSVLTGASAECNSSTRPAPACPAGALPPARVLDANEIPDGFHKSRLVTGYDIFAGHNGVGFWVRKATLALVPRPHPHPPPHTDRYPPAGRAVPCTLTPTPPRTHPRPARSNAAARTRARPQFPDPSRPRPGVQLNWTGSRRRPP
ncbi:hypothetical protein NicSoilB4_14680 [Arthrobacter sp. NicSoilB4]|nr:hypothetical protein NicSoilB4_14680 [Arthrobacter sp. NicSoilB4]